MTDVEVKETGGRHAYAALPEGISEARSLDFYSPYGCSKGGADQYVRDYSRIYGLRAVVLRQSCIYGERQFGIEDQGWVAWFTIAHMLNRPITLYGTGKQVRDLLYIDDLVDLYRLCVERIERASGEIYNIGGGPENTASLLEVIDCLEELTGRRPAYSLEDWRLGDQWVFTSDISKAERDFAWRPRVGICEGIGRLYRWVEQNRALISSIAGDGLGA
jgi:CDP-paratose 2-epimerase